MTKSNIETEAGEPKFHFSTPDRDRAAYQILTAICREFRSPLNTVIGMSGLTLRSDLDIEQRENLQIISKNACHILKTLNDVLGFFGTDDEDAEADFDLDTLLGSVLREAEAEAEKKGLFPESDKAADVLRYLRGYPLMLRSVLAGLTDNAIRFTEKGGITLSVRNDTVTEKPPGKISLLFSVRDTGIGIPEERCQRIFEAFGPGESRAELKLGLAGCRRRVERMGGVLRVNSEVGRGSEFFFTAVFEAGDAANIQSSLWEKEKSGTKDLLPLLKILIAEENPSTAKMISKMLKSWARTTVIAQDSFTLLRLLSEEDFDMVFIAAALQTQDMDIVRRIRSREFGEKNSRASVIIMADDMSSDTKEACKSAAADDLIVKPADLYEINRVMKKNIPVFSSSDPESPDFGENALLPDQKSALRRFGGDEAFYQEVCSLFIAAVPVIMQKLREAAARSQTGEIELHACSVKGLFGTLGAKSCIAVADRLEQAAAEEKTWQIPRLLERLELELELVMRHIAEVRNEK